MLKKYNIHLFTVIILSALTLVLSSFYTKKDDPKRKVKIIVIDPGHGGKDPGCSGHTHNEKTIALAVALKLGKLIEENMKDVKVIFTRKTDVFVDLEDRAKVAIDNNADLFLSIHCNAAGKPVMIKDTKTGKMRAKTFKNKKGKYVVVETANPEPYGAETYVMGMKNEEGAMRVAQRENAAILLEDDYEKKYKGFDPNSEESYILISNLTAGNVINSAKFAVKIQEQYKTKAGRLDKGVHRQSIWVLWRTAIPSVLTEIGYLTNPQEETFLGSEKGQAHLATCLFRAFRKYKDEQEGIKTNYNDAIENEKPLDPEVQVKQAKEDEHTTIDKPKDGQDTELKKDSLKQAEIEKLSSEKKYMELIAIADVATKNKNYDQAKILYDKANDLKTNDGGYATKKAEEINALIAKEKDAIEKEKEKINEQKEVDKAELIKKFKDKARIDSLKKTQGTETKTIVAVTKTTTTVSSKTLSAQSNTTGTISNDINFKVQFASNDKEVDAKLKYANVSDVSFYKAGGIFKYTSGSYKTLSDASKQQTKLRELGYKDCFVVAFKNGNRMDINEAKKLGE